MAILVSEERIMEALKRAYRMGEENENRVWKRREYLPYGVELERLCDDLKRA